MNQYATDYAQCEHCRCMRPKSALRISAQWEPTMLHCKDADWCLRSARIREEVEAEFERLSGARPPKPIEEGLSIIAPFGAGAVTVEALKRRDEKKKAKRRAAKAKIKRVCSTCGKDITMKKANAKFCNRVCKRKAAWVNRAK